MPAVILGGLRQQWRHGRRLAGLVQRDHRKKAAVDVAHRLFAHVLRDHLAPLVSAAQLKDEELRKKVAEAQERVKKSREETEANQTKFLAALEQIKVHLIEAIANHGDSITTVKPNEYISLIIMTDDMELRTEGGQRNRQQIVSVQKSLITDYKAGKLPLEDFIQKALQYGE